MKTSPFRAGKFPKDRVKSEVARFRYALGRTKDEMHAMHNKAMKAFGKSHAKLMDAYLLILNDPFLNKDVIRIIETRARERRIRADASDRPHDQGHGKF